MWRWEGGQLINRVGGKLALVNRSEGNSFKPWAAMRYVRCITLVFRSDARIVHMTANAYQKWSEREFSR